MIMMVLNKVKLRKIFVVGVSFFTLVFGMSFCIKKVNPTFNFTDVSLPYTQGTKKGSGYVGLTCNVDLGWENEYVEAILDALKKEDVKITFNVTGKWAEKNEELLLRIHKEGHEIGNHGHKHLDYAKISYEENFNQISMSKKIIEDIIKQETKFFQAPAGSFGEGTLKAANELGYTSIKWNIDTIDWQNRKEPEVVFERVKKKDMVENSIILMHPTYATSECIDEIIALIKERGFKAGRLSDIF